MSHIGSPYVGCIVHISLKDGRVCPAVVTKCTDLYEIDCVRFDTEVFQTTRAHRGVPHESVAKEGERFWRWPR